MVPHETHDTILPTSTFYNMKIKRLEGENKELQDSFELMSWMCEQNLKEIQTIQQEKIQLQRELDDKNGQFLEKEREHQQVMERLRRERDKIIVDSRREEDRLRERIVRERDELHRKKELDEDDSIKHSHAEKLVLEEQLRQWSTTTLSGTQIKHGPPSLVKQLAVALSRIRDLKSVCITIVLVCKINRLLLLS